ncbi:MAG: hypothetical protein IT239_07200, partial [Bacteroidia bacterium]|nr:hypothetical protein [Bacteroidia bacterium]
MKKIKLLSTVLLLSCAISSFAQVANYQFSSSTSTYTDLVGATVLKAANCTKSADTLIANVSIGFNFIYNGVTYTKVGIAGNGYLWFGSGTPTATVYTPISGNLGANVNGVISGIGRQLVARTSNPCGEISIKTEGSSGSQIFTVQYKNYQEKSFFQGATVYNFQIKLFESTNTIQTTYGAFTMTGAISGTCEVGLRGLSNADYNNRKSTTNWASSTAGTANNNTLTLSTSVYPASGLTYAWTPPVVCSGTPVAGAVSSSSSSYCYNKVATLNLQGQTVASGITITWQKSLDSLVWSSIGSLTTVNDTVKQKQYYRVIVKCTNSDQEDTTNTFILNLKPTYACYCAPTHTDAACSNGGYIDSIYIANTTFKHASNCQENSGTAYSMYDENITTASLQAGDNYTIGVKTTASNIISVWIDYNQNGTYEASEWKQITTSSTANAFSTIQITIPANALGGKTGMRVRSRGAGGANAATDACTQFASGETEDYVITIIPAVPCQNPPTAGNTILNTTDSVCYGSVFQASLQGNSTGLGQTYQWQTSADGVTWADKQGATNTTFSDSVKSTIHIRCNVTCGTTVASSEVVSHLLPASLCYCVPASTNSNCGNGGYIDSVYISNTNFSNASACDQLSGTAYSKYPATGNKTTSLNAGSTYTFNVRTTAANIISVWIDYNQNGTYDASEWKQVTTASTANAFSTVQITIPDATAGGKTGMRIRTRSTNAANAGTDACTQFGSGETEDYYVTIIPAPPCQNPPIAGAAVSNVTSACSGATFTANLQGNSTGLGQTYQWQTSADGITWNNIAGDTTTSLSDTLHNSVYIKCNVTCGTTVSSDSIFIGVTPANLCYCAPLSTNNNCGNGGYIDSVSIDNTNFLNVTGCDQLSGTAYSKYPESGSKTTSLVVGSNYKLNVKTTANNKISVWIDYNRNGVFDANEWTQVTTSSTANAVSSVMINIPFTALSGKTGMRIRSRGAGGANAATDACTQFASGETEDYIITLLPAPAFDLGVVSVSKPQVKNCYGMEQLRVVLRNNGTDSIDFSVTPANLSALKSTPSASSSTAQISAGIINSGDTISVSFVDLFDLSSPGNHQFNISLQFNDSNLSNNQLSHLINSTNPTALITGDTTLCDSSQTITLNGSGTGNGGFLGLTYSWSTGANGQNVQVTPNATTTYTLTVIDVNNCTAKDTAVVTIRNKPSINITGDTAACIGSTVSFTAHGGNTYTWNIGGNTNTVSMTLDTTATVVVEGNDGYCSNFDTATVYVKYKPIIDSSNAVITNSNCNQKDGSIVGITASGNGTITYIWKNTSGVTVGTIADLDSVTFGKYTLTVADDYCTSLPLSIDIANIGAPNAPSSPAPQTICLGSSAVLTAIPSQNGNLSWYSDAALTNNIGTG